MSTKTEKLKLFKYDVVSDKNRTFSITEALNNNWDKIDEFASSNTGYVKGCVNSGSVDENGEPDLMTYTGDTRTVNVKSPFVYTTVSGKTYECTEDLSLVLDDTLTGSVRIWADKDDDGTFYLKPFANNIFTQKFEPETAKENDVWINTSIAPETQKIKTSAGWEVFEGVEIGALTGL